ncbi:MAG: hypothetical protein JW829_18705 [Pirellulales bacterium]|nr:hypothetical protein [Pirellulales bacterium]
MAVAVFALTSSIWANSISLNFSENSSNQAFSGGENIGPLNTDSRTWNTTNGQPNLSFGTMNNLIDNNGNPTTASVTWNSANPWWNEDGTGDDQHRLAVGYLDDTNEAISVTLSDIPYAMYRVYGLYSSDQSWDATIVQAQDMQVNGTWVFGGVTSTSVNAYGSITDCLAETGQYWSHLDSTTPGNYWTFDTTGPALSIVQSPNADPGRAAISGLIIVEIPEPATSMLCGIAFVFLGAWIVRKHHG